MKKFGRTTHNTLAYATCVDDAYLQWVIIRLKRFTNEWKPLAVWNGRKNTPQTSKTLQLKFKIGQKET